LCTDVDRKRLEKERERKRKPELVTRPSIKSK
jgi:hypothetical protein